MAARQSEMFDKPRRPRVIRARIRDAGNGPGPGQWGEFECPRCGWRSGWVQIANVTTGKRGVPCEKCN